MGGKNLKGSEDFPSAMDRRDMNPFQRDPIGITEDSETTQLLGLVQRFLGRLWNYRRLAYSALAWLMTGRSESASFIARHGLKRLTRYVSLNALNTNSLDA